MTPRDYDSIISSYRRSIRDLQIKIEEYEGRIEEVMEDRRKLLDSMDFLKKLDFVAEGNRVMLERYKEEV